MLACSADGILRFVRVVTTTFLLLEVSFLAGLSTSAGHKTKGNDHQRQNALVYQQILFTGTLRDICREVTRMCMLMSLNALRDSGLRRRRTITPGINYRRRRLKVGTDEGTSLRV